MCEYKALQSLVPPKVVPSGEAQQLVKFVVRQVWVSWFVASCWSRWQIVQTPAFSAILSLRCFSRKCSKIFKIHSLSIRDSTNWCDIPGRLKVYVELNFVIEREVGVAAFLRRNHGVKNEEALYYWYTLNVRLGDVIINPNGDWRIIKQTSSCNGSERQNYQNRRHSHLESFQTDWRRSPNLRLYYTLNNVLRTIFRCIECTSGFCSFKNCTVFIACHKSNPKNHKILIQFIIWVFFSSTHILNVIAIWNEGLVANLQSSWIALHLFFILFQVHWPPN